MRVDFYTQYYAFKHSPSCIYTHDQLPSAFNAIFLWITNPKILLKYQRRYRRFHQTNDSFNEMKVLFENVREKNA